MQETFFFAYGTLRRQYDNKMARFLGLNAEFVDEAIYQGKLYQISSYPGAIPSNDPGAVIHGEVYHLRDPDPTLSRLDQYEECGPGFPEPTEYIRKMQSVQLGTGETVPAWVYLYNRSTDRLEPIRSGDFFRSRLS